MPKVSRKNQESRRWWVVAENGEYGKLIMLKNPPYMVQEQGKT